jgi:hypothetical protein
MGRLEIEAINPIRTDTWTSLHWVARLARTNRSRQKPHDVAADADPRVYLVDLSVEIVRGWAGPSREVGMNDLYWTLAGLN